MSTRVEACSAVLMPTMLRIARPTRYVTPLASPLEAAVAPILMEEQMKDGWLTESYMEVEKTIGPETDKI